MTELRDRVIRSEEHIKILELEVKDLQKQINTLEVEVEEVKKK